MVWAARAGTVGAGYRPIRGYAIVEGLRPAGADLAAEHRQGGLASSPAGGLAARGTMRRNNSAVASASPRAVCRKPLV